MIASRPADQRLGNATVVAVLLMAVGYNFLLAIFNAQVMSIGPAWAYAVELEADGDFTVTFEMTLPPPADDTEEDTRG